MNQQQRKYACERLESICNLKAQAIRDSHKIPAKRITDQERWKLIKAGKVPFAKGLTLVTKHTAMFQLYDFSSFEYPSTVSKGCCKELEKLKERKTNILDELMLGDEKKALELIEKFSSDKL